MTYKNAKEWKCQYCNLIIKSRRALYAHFRECSEKAKLSVDSLGRTKIPGIAKKAADTFRKKVEAGEALYKSRKLTEESKKKISEGRLKALREGRGNHWICPHIKRSYAEQYFYDAFQNAKLEFKSNVWLCRTILCRFFSW